MSNPDNLPRGGSNRRYEEALGMMRSAQSKEAFREAESALRALAGFRDADALADRCRERAETCLRDDVYAAALWQMERGSVSGYISAAQLFDSIPGWKDADAQAAAARAGIERLRQESARAEEAARRRKRALRRAGIALAALIPLCAVAGIVWRRAIAPRARYRQALALLEREEYAQAWSLLENLELPGSDERRAEVREALNSRAEVGSLVLFGSWEQDGHEENGPEAILWRVLEKDGDRLLLLSEYGMEPLPFERPARRITWAECQLRSWLNGAFLEAAFASEEQERICVSPVSADRNPSYRPDPGAETRDRLFLLSVEEAYRYLPSAEERQCFATPWAKKQMALSSRENGRAWWWLRTPGQVLNYAAFVLDGGEIREDGYHVSYAYITVRPAMWVCLPSAEG